MATARTETPLHVVIAGAGVAGLEALIALRIIAGNRVAHEFENNPSGE